MHTHCRTGRVCPLALSLSLSLFDEARTWLSLMRSANWRIDESTAALVAGQMPQHEALCMPHCLCMWQLHNYNVWHRSGPSAVYYFFLFFTFPNVLPACLPVSPKRSSCIFLPCFVFFFIEVLNFMNV